MVSIVIKNKIKEFKKIAEHSVISYILMARIWYREKMNSVFRK